MANAMSMVESLEERLLVVKIIAAFVRSGAGSFLVLRPDLTPSSLVEMKIESRSWD